VAWLLLLLLALFPVLAALADLISDFGGGLPMDHQETFAALAGEQWSSARADKPGMASYIALLETGYAIHELVFGILFLVIVAIPLRRRQWWAWYLAWVVLLADVGYTLTFGRHDATVFSRALIADIALPVLLLAQLPWLLGQGE
jgi:hypothetical protein